MSTISDSYRQKIHQLTQFKAMLISQNNQLPDAHYQILSIEAQIHENELWLEKYNYVKYQHLCSQCGGGFNDDAPEMPHITLRTREDGQSNVICSRCLQTIRGMMASTEAEESRGLPLGTIKFDCKNALKSLQKGNLVRKSGKFWLVHETALSLYYDHGRNKDQFDLSWIDNMRHRLNALGEHKTILEQMRPLIPDSYQQLSSLDAQIRDLESRFVRIEAGKLPYRCTLCNQWIKEEGIPVLYGEMTMCTHCINTIGQVMTTGEAEQKFQLPTGSLRRDIDRNLMDRYIKTGLLRLSGNLWLIHESALIDYQSRTKLKGRKSMIFRE